MGLPAEKTFVTPEEYLRLEAEALDKHEYHAGEILAMSGGTYSQSRITMNALSALHIRLKGSPCFVLESNMRLRIAKANRYVYPDEMVLCSKPIFDPIDKNQTTIINPKVIVEVLSPSTAAYDRGDKFAAYRELETFEEYVLISQDKPLVETFTRQKDGGWLFTPWRGVGASATLRSLQIDLPLAEVYHGLEFDGVQSV